MFNIVHLCGKGNLDESLIHVEGYRQFEYVTDELSDILFLANFVVSRAGSNSIFEFLALHKPMLLIPLSAAKSLGDQIWNANLFKRQGFAHVLEEEALTKDSFMASIEALIKSEEQIIDKMLDVERPKTPKEMVNLILQYEK